MPQPIVQREPPPCPLCPPSAQAAPVPSLPSADPVEPKPPETAPAPTTPVPSYQAPSGQLQIPVAGVTANALVDTYTQARGTGRSHDAIDIMASAGAPVVAADDGKIVKLFNS